MNAAEFARAIAADGKVYSGGSRDGSKVYKVRCPAHEDRNPSCTVWIDPKNKVAINCNTGCTHDQILAAINPHTADTIRNTWRPEPVTVLIPKRQHTPTPNHTDNPTIEYPYTDEHGQTLYKVVRRPGKQIRQWHLTDGQWQPGRPQHLPLYPYRLPDIIAANRAGDTIYIVEGEKDADNLAALGATATTNIGGAGKWTDDLNGWFVGAKVVIIPDNDPPGHEHARQIHQHLKDVADRAVILTLPNLPEKGDITDWLDAGGTLPQLDQHATQALHDANAPAESWRTIDLAALATGTIQHLDPPPTILQRQDGKALIYKGEINAISGEPESGKSWIGLVAIVQILLTGGHALYIDFEDTAGRIVRRLLDLHIPPETIISRFHYIRPDTPIGPNERAYLLDIGQQCELAVIDGVTDMFAVHGLDPLSNKDIADFYATLPRPLANAGPGVLLLDHVVKNKDNRGRYAIGGQHKLAAIRGANYQLETIQPFGRSIQGHAQLVVTKDRPGHVRPTTTLRGNKAIAADFHLSGDGPNLDYQIAPPQDRLNAEDWELTQHVLDTLAALETDQKGVAKSTLGKKVARLAGKRDAYVFAHIEKMESRRQIAVFRDGPYTYYRTGTQRENQ